MASVRLFLSAALLVTGVLSVPARQPRLDVSEDVTFYLYTQSNNVTPQVIKLDDDSSSSNFNSSNPTRFVIHGRNAQPFDEYREAYIATGKEYNIVLVDWSGPASGNADVNNSVPVGTYIGQVVNYLIKSRGLDPDDLHIIGHSIGAHVAGIAGKAVDGEVAEVVALDPANDAYNDREYAGLAKSDAKFVQVLHSSGVSFGMLESQGHVDFFPNGGTQQPGCDEGMGCDHRRAIVYHVESINNNNFVATQCSSYEEYKQGACSANERTVMGEYAPLTLSGWYYLDTNEQSPYAQGKTDL